jgi:molybdenum cofactor cytidylyltransferase
MVWQKGRFMVVGVILAAGQARRMGKSKQLLQLGGKPMIWHVATEACLSNLDQVIVITGAYDADVKQALRDFPLQVIYNEHWEKGQSTSVKKAVQALIPESEVIVFLLGDQPLVDRVLVNNLVSTYQETKATIVIPRFQNQPGNPVLFDLSAWRSALLQLKGDEGARQIIRQHQEAIHYMELSDGQIFFDIDTPQDYERMQKLWQKLGK